MSQDSVCGTVLSHNEHTTCVKEDTYDEVPYDFFKRIATDEIIARQKRDDIEKLEKILKKKFMSEHKISDYEQKLEHFKKNTVLFSEEIEEIMRVKLSQENVEEEINKIVQELIELDTHIRSVHPHSASILMRELIHNRDKHLFCKEVKEKFLKQKELVDSVRRQNIQKSLDKLNNMCDFDFKELMVILGYPKDYII
jgi:hypothetical protein